MRIREITALREGKVVQVQVFNKNVRVYANPSRDQFINVLKRQGDLRGLIDEHGNLYFWDAMEATHADICRGLLLDSEVQLILASPDKDPEKQNDIQCEWYPIGDHDWTINDVPNFIRITKGYRVTGIKQFGSAKYEFDNR